jgi:hypothetical protein
MLTLALALALRNDGNYVHSCRQVWTAVKVGSAAWASPVCAFRLTIDEDSCLLGYDAVSIGRLATFWRILPFPSLAKYCKDCRTLNIEAAGC